MSHFSVSVFTKEGQTVAELLAPYQENNMGTCPEKYLKFYDLEKEYRNKYENDGTEMVKAYDERLLYPWDEELRAPGKIGYGTNTHIVPKGYEKVFVKFKDLYPSFDVFMEKWCGYKKDPKTGKYGYWENPNAKWDWYQIGGRWSGYLKLKPRATSGEYGERSWINKNEVIPENMVDSAKVKDIDFSVDEKEYKEALRYWELVVEGDKPRDKNERDIVEHNIYGPEYFVKRYETKEQYALAMAEFSTYAVVTPDGIWHSQGEMGWFGCGSETDEEARKWVKSFKERFIDNADPEWTLTIVDCHI